ncbi:hypothetical protein JCGZ_22086 [Jatropha curcas]|uniref:Uncharacterized protein n=1 Tax=Jatropha curcas TaxID=180498 RepID=A0A067JSS6_JATCU|nr:hypothetical protein JCGZ_22086 [Jatropha curcas]
MTSSSHSSDEDLLESLGISLDEIRVTADADTHAFVTGVYVQHLFDATHWISVRRFSGPAPSQPLGTRSSRASGPSSRTPRRRPTTRLSSSTPVEGPSQAGPGHSAGAFKIPQAILKATGPIHPGLANLHLPYSIPYYTPDGTSSLREVSLGNVNPLALPPEDITERRRRTRH